jgi:hypothetical protein
MTIDQAPIVVGIFHNEIQAKHAVDAIRSAGFRYDQVGVAISSSSNATSDLQADLLNLGVPHEQASYYDNAYQAGGVVVSIRPDGRENEVQGILLSNGASNYEKRPDAAPPTEQQQDQPGTSQTVATDPESYQDEETQRVEAIQEASSASS